jgi:hypothetical protein
VGLYAWHTPLGVPNGGTWLGYGLGTLGAVLILWLTWFGVRKRRYGVGALQLKGWLSAHVYLGSTLLVVGTLHTGFQFGWNVHTLAYALMLLVIGSGLFGIAVYGRLPSLISANRSGLTLEQMTAQMIALDRDALAAAMPLGDEAMRAVMDAGKTVQVGGALWRLLSSDEPHCLTGKAIAVLERVATVEKDMQPAEAQALQSVLRLLYRKADLLHRARRDLRYKGLLDVWLYVHVPATFALLAALIAHVVSVFYFW